MTEIADLVPAGTEWVAGHTPEPATRVYPLGTARALGHLLSAVRTTVSEGM